MSRAVSVIEWWIHLSAVVAAATLVVIVMIVLLEEGRVRLGERARMRREVLRAERQLHGLAVAAFAEMLEEARLGQTTQPAGQPGEPTLRSLESSE